MRLELIDLLRNREIIQPSRISKIESKCDSNMSIEIVGFPWWLANPRTDANEKITLQIEGISDGLLASDLLYADPFDEDLEFFDVRPLSEQGWAKGDHCEIYCSNALSNPFEVYAQLHDFLVSINCPYGPDHYLNFGNSRSFNEFFSITSSKSYLLCQGPESVCQCVCDTLELNGTQFSVVKKGSFLTGLICLRLNETYLICKSAYAVI